MDSIRIMEEAPGEYTLLRQERERRKAQRRKVMNYIVVLCLAAACFLVCYTYMDYRIKGRALLGRAKNVELAIRLTAIEYYGFGAVPYDAGRESGLKKEAEKEIVKYAEADGQIRVLGWNEEANAPAAFIYREGQMLVFYTRGEDGQPDWQVCRIQNILSAE